MASVVRRAGENRLPDLRVDDVVTIRQPPGRRVDRLKDVLKDRLPNAQERSLFSS